jgi:outer membrane protein assembly factor BamB
MMRNLILIGAVALLSPPGRAAADWPRFRGPNGNGIVSDKFTLGAKPREIWAASVGEGNASLVVQNGRTYTVGSQRGRGPALVCLDAETGKHIWSRKLDAWSSDSSPTLAGAKGYVLCNKNPPSLICFRTSDGETIWRQELPGATGARHYGFAGSPTLWRDLVIVNVGLGMALKQDTGAVAWAHEGLAGLATPTLYQDDKGQHAVLIFAGDALYAREAGSGRELWSIPWKTELAVNACDPIYHDGKVFISTTYGKHAALFDVTTQPPRQLWKERGSSFSSGFLWDRHLFVFEGSEFSCLDLDGTKKWSSPGVGGGSALLAGDKIVLLSDRGRLLVAPASTESFRPLCEAQIHGGTTWTPPSLVHGKLLVRNKDGAAVCLQLGE